MKICEDFSITRRKESYCSYILLFNFDDTSTYIKVYKGSLALLTGLIEEEDRSVITRPGQIKTNYVYPQDKEKLKNLLQVIEIMDEKNRSSFDKNYFKLKKYIDVVANHKKYFKSIIKFLRG